jgi:hypothetical protein
MCSYFHGWKRKTGVVTLMAAMAFAGGWGRSIIAYNMLQIPVGETGYLFESANGSIGLSIIPKLAEPHGIYWVNDYERSEAHPIEEKLWEWNWAGFHFSGSTQGDGKSAHFIVPYGSIVVPLTLVSAWCLLTKLRASTKTGLPSPGAI